MTCHHRNPLHCIVPPELLRKLAEHADPAVQQAARQTLIDTARLRGQREILGLTFAGHPGGGLRRTIFDAHEAATTHGTRVRGEGEPPVAGNAAVNEAYDGLGATYKLYKEIFKRDSIDNKGMRLDAVVHYAHQFNNAFWNGAQMIFGDGDGAAFIGFTKAVDVIGHELTHGVTEFTCNLDYHFQSGALNESMSDVFGSLVKQYALQQTAASADWLIGNGILGPAIHGIALRSMKAPGTAFEGDDQPATMAGYFETPDTDRGDWGGVHRNSGIPNHAFFLVATSLGGHAWDDAGHIWYDTLLALNATSNFQDCANLSFSLAGIRFGSGSQQQKAVGEAWTQVGVKPAGSTAAAGANGQGVSTDGALKEALQHAALELQKVAGLL
jgi:Zn-dependent metalloprotease